MNRAALISFSILAFILSVDNCFSQKKPFIKSIYKPTGINISGTYQIRQFVSYDQVQEKDYRGTGSWQKFPCVQCPVTIIKKDSFNKIKTVFYLEGRRTSKKDSSYTRLGAYVTYTNYDGIFRCVLKEFKNEEEVYIIYGHSYSYKRRLKLTYDTDAGAYTEK